MNHVMNRMKSPIFKITFTSLILSGQLTLYLLTHLLHKEAMLVTVAVQLIHREDLERHKEAMLVTVAA